MGLSEELLARGYLPKELPPSFSSSDFAGASSSLKATPPNQWTQPVVLNLARPGDLRRRLAIPNPFAQRRLANECEEGWSTLEAHLKKSRISLSRPGYRPLGRALPVRYTPGARVARQVERMSRARFTLRSDLSEFYGSIYTHSIEWALHSKAAAKVAKKGTSKSLGALLDEAVRAGQDGQTKGIPIGPDTSLLLSELILCEIDSHLQSKFPAVAKYCTRFMDDLEFYAATRVEAEALLLEWDRSISSYDLALNVTKTRIVEGPIPPERPWRVPLSQFSMRDETDVKLANDLRSLFSLAFDLHAKYPTEYVLGYAIQRVIPRPRGRKSWAAFAQLCLAAVIADPSCLQIVSKVFGSASRAGLRIDKRALSQAMNEMCSYHAPFEHGSEVAWSLSIIRDHGLTVTEESADLVAGMRDNCSLLLLWDLIDSGKVEGGGPDMTSAVQRAEHVDAWRSEDWLLAYEACRRGWANDKEFRKQTHWNELLKLGVAFFLSLPTSAVSGPVVPGPAAPGPSEPEPSGPGSSVAGPSEPGPSEPAPIPEVPAEAAPQIDADADDDEVGPYQ